MFNPLQSRYVEKMSVQCIQWPIFGLRASENITKSQQGQHKMGKVSVNDTLDLGTLFKSYSFD